MSPRLKIYARPIVVIGAVALVMLLAAEVMEDLPFRIVSFGAVLVLITAFFVMFDREQARTEAVRRSLYVTLDSVGDAVIVTDRAGRVVFINPVAQHLTGWASTEAVGRTLDEVLPIVHETTREVVESPFAKVMRVGSATDLADNTVLLARNDGTNEGLDTPIGDSSAPIRDEQGKIGGVVLVFRDIGEAQREVKRREFLAEATAALSSSLDYRATLRRLTRLIVPLLADWCAVQIVEEDDLPYGLAVAHQDRQKTQVVAELLRRYAREPLNGSGIPHVIQTGKPELNQHVDRGALLAKAVDAKHRALLAQLEISSSMIVPLTARGKTFGAIAFVQGESSRHYGPDDLVFAGELGRNAAVAIDNALLYAKAQNAIAIRDEFLTIASHELNTPLTPLKLQLQMLRPKMPSPLLPALAIAERQVDRMTKLVGQLLDVSRLAAGRFSLDLEPVNLSELLREVASRCATEGAGTSVRVTADTIAVGDFDRLRIEQALTNLLSNAVKYGSNKPIDVVLDATQTSAHIQVQDHGIGIEPAMQNRIFERFERAVSARHYGGFGLGLWITRQIIEASGGHIHVDSVPGEGSTFSIDLPLSHGA